MGSTYVHKPGGSVRYGLGEGVKSMAGQERCKVS